jgi:adenylate kinase
MSEDRTFIILLGPPASGKGTQAARLEERLELPHVASGDLFRYNLKNETDLGLKAKAYMERGALVPDDLTIAMVLDRLERSDTDAGALLDGFPRTIAQAEALDQALAQQDDEVDRVLNIQVPDEVILERITGRRVCKNCGATYHIKYKAPQEEGVCDACGGELYQRADDTEETARKRIEVYREQTAPLIDYYEEQGMLVDIEGDQAIEAVTTELVNAVEDLRTPSE